MSAAAFDLFLADDSRVAPHQSGELHVFVVDGDRASLEIAGAPLRGSGCSVRIVRKHEGIWFREDVTEALLAADVGFIG